MAEPMSTSELLRLAAAGREEYALHAPSEQALILRAEATTLLHAANVADGQLDIMRTWLPPWRWNRLPEGLATTTEVTRRSS